MNVNSVNSANSYNPSFARLGTVDLKGLTFRQKRIVKMIQDDYRIDRLISDPAKSIDFFGAKGKKWNSLTIEVKEDGQTGQSWQFSYPFSKKGSKIEIFCDFMHNFREQLRVYSMDY